MKFEAQVARTREIKLVVQEIESKHLSSGTHALTASPLMHATHP